MCFAYFIHYTSFFFGCSMVARYFSLEDSYYIVYSLFLMCLFCVILIVCCHFMLLFGVFVFFFFFFKHKTAYEVRISDWSSDVCSSDLAIGGIGKGHLVREIDALGGVMAKAADAAGIQWRRLNASKGPAVRATRCQADRGLYRAYIRRAVEAQPNLTIFQSDLAALLIEHDGSRNDRVRVALSHTTLTFEAPAVEPTGGTFHAPMMPIGPSPRPARRTGDTPPGRPRPVSRVHQARRGGAAEPHHLPIRRRRPADRARWQRERPRARRAHQHRPALRGARGGAHRRHLPRRQDPCRPDAVRRRAHGRPAGDHARRETARAPVRGRSPQDRHAAAHRRTHARLFGDDRAARRRSAPGVLVHGFARRPSAPGVVLDHPHQRAHPRHHSRRARPLAAVFRPDRRHRPALLPVDRGQGGALRREGQPPDLRRARGAWGQRDLSQRHFHLAAVRHATGPGSLGPPLSDRPFELES